MCSLEKSIEKSNEKLVHELKNLIKCFSINDRISKCFILDLKLLSLNHDLESIKDYCESCGVYPGYSKFLATISFLAEEKNVTNYNGIPKNVLKHFNCILDRMIINGSENTLYAMQLAQRDWQRKYIFKTYLFHLFLEDKAIASLFNQFTSNSIDDLVSLSLLPRFLAEPIILKCIRNKGLSFYDCFNRIVKYIDAYYDYISINIETFREIQEEKLKVANYNLFHARMIIKDYPVIKLNDGSHFFSSFFYLQDALFSRTIRLLANSGQNSRIIGDAFEYIVFNAFTAMYSHCDLNATHKSITLGPNTKKSGELCDILIQHNNQFLLIDCKAKELIEEIFIVDSTDEKLLIEKYQQRMDRIKDITDGKFSKYIPKHYNKDNIYSIIALFDDGTYSKEQLFARALPSLTHEDKDYYLKHIHTISFDDLLEAIVSNVDLISVITNSINSKSYNNHLSINIRIEEKSDYNPIFDNWYNNACIKMEDFCNRILFNDTCFE